MKFPAIVLVTPEQIERVLALTDTFSLSRDSVVIPLKTMEPDGKAMVLPDGKVLLHPPPAPTFEAWLKKLPEALASMDLRKTRRAS